MWQPTGRFARCSKEIDSFTGGSNRINRFTGRKGVDGFTRASKGTNQVQKLLTNGPSPTVGMGAQLW